MINKNTDISYAELDIFPILGSNIELRIEGTIDAISLKENNRL